MKKYLFSMVAVAAMLAMSAFTVAHHTSKMPPPGFFYKFIGDVSDPDQLGDRTLWERGSDDCDGSFDVCGVYLPNDQTTGSHPLTEDFNSVKGDILSSQDEHSAQNGAIVMKN